MKTCNQLDERFNSRRYYYYDYHIRVCEHIFSKRNERDHNSDNRDSGSHSAHTGHLAHEKKTRMKQEADKNNSESGARNLKDKHLQRKKIPPRTNILYYNI